MGENAAQRLAAVQAMVEQMAKVASTHRMRMVEVTRELFMDTVVLPLHDPTIARDIEAGAALNSDKAERVLYEALTRIVAQGEAASYWEVATRAILAALREGLADDPDALDANDESSPLVICDSGETLTDCDDCGRNDGTHDPEVEH